MLRRMTVSVRTEPSHTHYFYLPYISFQQPFPPVFYSFFQSILYYFKIKMDKTQQQQSNKNRRKTTPEVNTSIIRNLQPSLALLNQWTPEDDIALIAAVTHVN